MRPARVGTPSAAILTRVTVAITTGPHACALSAPGSGKQWRPVDGAVGRPRGRGGVREGGGEEGGRTRPWGLCFHSIILGQIENGIENISASWCVMSVFVV